MTAHPFRFTVAVSFYDVERYLPATLRSLERQTYGIDRIQVVLVDDGSTDGSALIAERWARGRPNVRVVRQENAGPGHARNRALEVAEGEWYTSVDGDDLVDRDYFAAVARLLDRDRDGRAGLVAPRLYLLDDRTGRFRDAHPLGQKFRFGDRLARLQDEPEAFVLGTAFMLRTDVLRRHGLRYDGRIVPTYEDAHLIGRYLAHLDDPVVAVAARAHYFYRKRSTSDSLVQSAWSRPERFTVVPELGYLDLLRYVTSVRGTTPVWAQYMVLYDLLWYLKEEQSMTSQVAWVDGDLARRFLELVVRIMEHVDAATIERFPCNAHPWTTRQALLVRYADDGLVPRVHRWGDDAEGHAQVSVMHRGPVPALRAFCDGVEVRPEVTGTRLHAVFGEELMTETSVRWRSGAEVSLWVGGVPAVLRTMRSPRWGRPPRPRYRLSGAPAHDSRTVVVRRIATARRVTDVAALATTSPRVRVVARLAAQLRARRRSRAGAAARSAWVASMKELARAPEVRDRYAGAWIVMDRRWVADDNGEHLYRHLLRERPDIDAYFFLERDSADWDRLAADGFRLVDLRSDEAVLIALNAAARISSDAVEGCMYPVPRRDFGALPGIFVFLQHGVSKDDISRWLNGKRIDLLTTATEAEHESFVGPGSPYALKGHEVALTGFPRYDRLVALREETDGEPRSILVMPTWRRALHAELEACASDADRRRVLEASDFGQAWLALLRSDRLAALSGELRQPVRLLLHPHLDRVLPAFPLPAHVQRVDPSAAGFQSELVRSALLVTDYTSVAFDAAYTGVPVVYFQFDQETVFSGAHTQRRGYFDYATDGFGPVATDADAALACIADAVGRGFAVQEPYRSRVAGTFAHRDARNGERVAAAIERRIRQVAGS
ncbi:bifunctional glycosyltransferase/CDP-glycerol:glycerophosphate glycerophosphotransferase [Cellulomonas hominis]|uniref:bifunctional glycosyltransferase/CDP-glycerol:glycerophosphate glycerophosphotransferase n=1 Tax=Cellulomonas hominis TaxID=156981 RepID=UPI001B9C8129|nr:glycosyltransferase [Cellulomonas hominis]VTR78292.1 Putative glycosyltransferase EpsH [Cellulomonas hominis]